jgi:hypothetical protein
MRAWSWLVLACALCTWLAMGVSADEECGLKIKKKKSTIEV